MPMLHKNLFAGIDSLLALTIYRFETLVPR